MESSDDKFAWTSASSDSAGDSETMAADKMNDSSHGEESESGKKYKKKLQKQLFQERETPQRARVKREPDSDDGGARRRERRARREAGAGSRSALDASHDASADDSYLALRVKQELEQASFAPPEPVRDRKRKRSRRNGDSATRLDSASNESESSGATKLGKSKKRKRDSEPNDSTNESERNTDLCYIKNERSESTPAEKKKKSKKSRPSESNETYELNDMMIEDKFSAEETVVETRFKVPKRDSSTVVNGTNNVGMGQSNDIKSCKVKPNITYSSKEFISDESDSDDDAGDRNKSKTVDPHQPSLDGSRRDSEASDHRTTVTPATGRTHQALKISDRIQFEDDTMDTDLNETAEDGSDALGPRVRRYLRARTHLRPLRPRPAHHARLAGDDEVWVLKCPHDLDVTTLTGTDVSLDTDSKCKIKIDGQTYNGSVDDENSRIALLTMERSKLVIKNVPVMGTVRFRKRIPKAHFVTDNCIQNNQTNFIPLPETKLRHPLFGPDYKRAMKIPASVKARLKNAEAVSPSPCTEKKKKKKHKKEKSDPEEEEPAERSPSPRVKKRKHKHTDTEEPTPKKKRIKRESADNWDSEKAIEENLFNF